MRFAGRSFSRFAPITADQNAASRYGGPSWLVPLGLCLALAFLIHGWHRGARIAPPAS